MKLKSCLALALAVTIAAFVSGCGGGGGNPGECFGGDAVCAGLDGEQSPTFVAVPTADLSTVNCTDILKANGGDVPLGRAAAQDAYLRGARQLDGSPEDGIACNGVF